MYNSLECGVCDGEVISPAWFTHECFTADPRNIWLTPPPNFAPTKPLELSGMNKQFIKSPTAGVTLCRLWDKTHSSFKTYPVAFAASVGASLGFRSFGIVSCGSAAWELMKWCRAASMDVEVWIPQPVSLSLETWGFKPRRIGATWSEAYKAFWIYCEQSRFYPLFPSGDPWFLSALRLQAREVLAQKYDYIILPCGSGVHILAYLEEGLALGSRSVIVGVQIAGNDPLVTAWKQGGNLQNWIPARSCVIDSMWSQRPVNLLRIVRTAKSYRFCRFESVSEEDVHSTKDIWKPYLSMLRWQPDESLYALIAAAVRSYLSLGQIVALSTAGEYIGSA